MTGDGVGELQLRPVVAVVLDQTLTLCIIHPQRQLSWTDVHDLAGSPLKQSVW
jgi:hypothetical protein